MPQAFNKAKIYFTACHKSWLKQNTLKHQHKTQNMFFSKYLPKQKICTLVIGDQLYHNELQMLVLPVLQSLWDSEIFEFQIRNTINHSAIVFSGMCNHSRRLWAMCSAAVRREGTHFIRKEAFLIIFCLLTTIIFKCLRLWLSSSMTTIVFAVLYVFLARWFFFVVLLVENFAFSNSAGQLFLQRAACWPPSQAASPAPHTLHTFFQRTKESFNIILLHTRQLLF